MSHTEVDFLVKTQRSILNRFRPLIVAGLIIVHFALAISSARLKSPTADEPFHLARGVSAMFSGDFRLSVAHPPLINLINTVPLLFVEGLRFPFIDGSWKNRKADISYRKSRFAWLFLWRLNRNPQEIIMLARVPTMILSCLLGLVVFFFSKKLFGYNAGIFSLFLYCFCPNMLAHARLISTDTGASLTILAVFFTLRNYLEKQSWRSFLLAAFAFALAQLSKFTAILLYPVILIVLFVRPGMPVKKRATRALLEFIAITAIALVFIWAGYGFEMKSQHSIENLNLDDKNTALTWRLKKTAIKIIENIKIPPRTYFYGIARTFANTEKHTHSLYFMGELSREGWWYYYPVLFLIKTPLPLLILMVMGVILSRASPKLNTLDRVILLFPPVFLFIAFMFLNRMNIGIRHILPIFPFIHVWLGRLIVVRFRRRALYLAGLGLLSAWYAAGTIAVHPDYLVYFNETVGGPEGGLKYSVLGEDWGQDIAGLGRYVREHRIRYIYYTPYGNTDPHAYGINYEPIKCKEPRAGIFAVHRAEKVRPLDRKAPDCYAWLDAFEPTEIIGHTILIYEISESAVREMSAPRPALDQEPHPPSRPQQGP